MNPQVVVAMRRVMVLFFRGSLKDDADLLLKMLSATRWWPGVSRWRFAGHSDWQNLAGTPAWSLLGTELAANASPSGFWRLELDGGAAEAGPRLEIANLPPVRGMERASYIKLRFDDHAESAAIAAFGGRIVNDIPLWWGSAGYAFEHVSGQQNLAHAELAALARRYWGVQLLDLSALQWDALAGMPSVNWLQLVGTGFAQAAGVSIDRLASAANGALDEGIFHRRGAHGLALAAGPQALKGDINARENLSAYVRMAGLLQPLLLEQHQPLAGPLAKPDVLSAWLHRFTEPQAWLDCDIHAE